MFGFILKKSFCDGWDNLLTLVVTNIIYLFIFVFFGIFLIFGAQYPLLFTLVFLVLLIVSSIYSVSYGKTAADISNFKGIKLSDFFKEIPSSVKDGFLLGMLTGIIIIISTFCIRYYVFQMNVKFGFFLGAVIFWLDLIILLALQWFVPIRSLLKNDFKKSIKKCFLIFFDNTGFSIAIGLYGLVLYLLSFILAGFLPSIAGVLIAKTNALRILLYKYDYLEQHPELTTPKERKQIPWEELIYDDRESLGPRKLKTFLFPWKMDN